MNPPDQLIDDLRLLEPPEPWQVNWWLVAAALAVLVLLLFVLRHFQRGRAARLQAHAIRTAHADALAALQKLFAMVEQEQSRPYAIDSSSIIRRYLEDGFGLQAPRRATDEFLLEAQQSPKLSSEQRASLAEFLRCCDLLKFARTSANRAELEQLHSAAVNFVQTAPPAPEEVAP
ncbi:MAG TPA: hypothetical protein VF614_06525 [Chthoniobacteraceae bacterium]|jgi:hypothetical protein